eukprot:4161049-Amphidinium_carterae.2
MSNYELHIFMKDFLVYQKSWTKVSKLCLSQFDSEGSYAEHKASGELLYFQREGVSYKMLMSCKAGSIEPGHGVWNALAGVYCGLFCVACGVNGTSVWRHLS